MNVPVLIVDANATGRMALKAKLASALYDVVQATSGAEALHRVQQDAPQIVIASDTLPDMSLAALARAIHRRATDSAPPIIALTQSAGGRLGLLDAGAEDVLPRPAHAGHLIARIRSVLRSHAAAAEWRLRDLTSRALGFAEPATLFDRSTEAVLLGTPGTTLPPNLMTALAQTPDLHVTQAQVPQALTYLQGTQGPDVVLFALDPGALGTLADLRAHPALRRKALLAIAPHGAHDLAAKALDLGADDVALAPAPGLFAAQDMAAEITLRVQRLQMRQQMAQSLRTTVRRRAEAALRDPLTGLYNRRYALPHLARIAEQAEQTARPFAVMVADLDHFKRINDTYGHAAGDAVLVECARRLQQNMRAMDLLARIGGEEFLIVTPGTDRRNARQAAARLCEKISGKPFVVPGLEGRLTVTISVGLAVSHTQADLFDTTADLSEPEQVLQRADRALYEAKRSGRNRFSFERSEQRRARCTWPGTGSYSTLAETPASVR